MKKKNTNIEKTSNRDILKNKIIQLNEAVFVKKRPCHKNCVNGRG